jgi:hypothetical protein
MISTRLSALFCLSSIHALLQHCNAYCNQVLLSRHSYGHVLRQPTALKVSELHVQGYAQSKLPFIIKDEHLQETNPDGTVTIRKLQEMSFGLHDFESKIPHDDGNLLHKTKSAVFSQEDCQRIVDEAEAVASRTEWSKNRHGNVSITGKRLNSTFILSGKKQTFSNLVSVPNHGPCIN